MFTQWKGTRCNENYIDGVPEKKNAGYGQITVFFWPTIMSHHSGHALIFFYFVFH